MSFANISDILSKRINKPGLAKQITAALVCEEFDKLIFSTWGDKIKDMAQTMYLKDNILTVACLSSTIAQELKLREGELIKQINDKFGHDVVERLRLLS